MKNYSEYVSIWDVTSIIWVLVFLLIILKMTRKFGEKNSIVFMLLFLMHCILSAAFILWSPLPEFSDTHTFAYLVKETEWNITQSRGVQFWFFLSYPFRLLSGFSLTAYIFLQIFLYFSSAIILLYAFINLEGGALTRKTVTIYAVLVSIFPSTFLYIDQPLREAWLIFGFSFSLYSFSLIKQYGFRYRFFGIMLIGFLVTILTRPQIIVCYFLLYLFFVGLTKKNTIALILVAMVSPFFFTYLTGYRFDPEFFAYIRNSQIENSPEGSVYGQIDSWVSYFDILTDLPLLTLQFIFSPLPILHGNSIWSMKALMAVFSFMCCIFYCSLMSSAKMKNRYLLVYLCFSAIFSVWEFYIGAAIRHRFPLDLMLFPLAAHYLGVGREK